MPTNPPPDITRLLRAWRAGDPQALERLIPLVYDELRRIARRYVERERQGQTLQATALVNEAYTRLVDVMGVPWQDRAHFFAVSAEIMRHILVDTARARAATKRGGQAARISLDDAVVTANERSIELLALDEALNRLSQFDERKAKVVELRYFGGLNFEETGEVLGVSERTVKRDWSLARAWLARAMAGAAAADNSVEH